MIIFRYIARDLLVATLAVSAVLLAIFLTGQFSRYLNDAAQGKLAVDVLFTVIGFRSAGLLELILPLGFYLAILLSYGRMYMESEMVVLSACGMSPGQLVRITLIPALLVAAIVASFSFWISPIGAQYAESTLAEQRNRSEFDSIQAGRFQAMDGGKIMAYVESVSDHNQQLDNVFVAQTQNKDSTAIVVADSGGQQYLSEFGQRYLVLQNGYRYEGQPGSSDFTVTHFKEWGQYLSPVTSVAETELKTDAKTTAQLLEASDNESRATLQWRLSMPLMVFIAALLAVPLSKTNPRQGRYMKMLPAILVYVLYLTFLINARSSVTKGKMDADMGLLLVHLPFFAAAVLMLTWHKITQLRVKSTGVSNA